ncbi:alpha/beta fold hydrolase [Streptomyces sp. 2A115]|uniref:alpha/beta fold hydrolase n=1 Tax=Streptomyces sp. 2A115 TaxID=3457439 RepID=UPI003FD3DF20
MSAKPRADAERYAVIGSGIRLCYRTDGDPGGTPVVLIGGLGEDLTSWSPQLVSRLVDAGHHVIRHDNRDVGRSTFAETPSPALWRQALARPRADAYTLVDMAGDTVGLLNHLAITSAHLVGRSMGGMIAQIIATRRPALTASLTSMYSTTGARRVGQPAPSTILRLMAPPPKTRDTAVRAHLSITAHIAGTAYPIDEREETEHPLLAWERADATAADGVARQVQAIHASGDRTAEVATIAVPTLVVHGDRDVLVAPSGGVATARAIRGVRHVVIPGMGHHLPAALAALADNVADLVIDHVGARTDGGRG